MLKRILIIVVTIFLLLSCHSVDELKITEGYNQNLLPYKRDITNSIAIGDITFNIEKNDNVGYHYTGLYPVKLKSYEWNTEEVIDASNHIIHFPERLLSSMGYTVYTASDKKNEIDQRSSARYKLHAKINDLKFNTYSYFTKEKLTTFVDIEWSLIDSKNDKTLYTQTSKGRYLTKNTYSNSILIVALGKAVNDSLKLLLSNSEFSTIIPDGKDPIEKIFIKDSGSLAGLSLPGDTEDVLDGVVVIYHDNGHGSGSLISSDGYILTAAHVVGNSGAVYAKLYDDREFKAKIIRVNSEKDLALLKIDAENLKYLSFRNEKMKIGKDIYAIGAPLSKDLSYSVSKGIISSYRKIDEVNLIQTDANINPGNSGGPLLDSMGQIVGVVSWKIVAEGFEGLAFGVDSRFIGEDLTIEFNK